MQKTNIFELADIITLMRTKSNIASELGLEPSTVTRWGNQIPGDKQLELLYILNNDVLRKREYNKIRKRRLEKERDTG